MLMKPFWETTPDDWAGTIDVNLLGVLNCTRHALAAMVPEQRGSIVTVISEAARHGDRNMEAYAGAKAGAAGVMRSVARDVGRLAIRANCVAIAATRTPPMEPVFANEDFLKAALRSYPLGRIGEPDDAANVVLFLASDAASFVTGQVYAVNGGFHFGL
jgi:3-oxoacyl-[acyl-carrier protein] reductase